MAHDGILHSQTILKVPTKQVTLAMEHALSIPCPDLTDEDRDHDFHQKHGLGFARQEDWAGLPQAIASAEETRAKTTGGMPVAELLALGARTDVVSLVEHALITGKPDRDAPIMEGIEALEDVLSDHSDDAIIASIIAQAHMDIGWAWRGTGADILVPAHNREAFDAHFERAADILAGFDQNNIKIPLFAATRCALNAGLSAAVEKIVADYETWLNLIRTTLVFCAQWAIICCRAGTEPMTDSRLKRVAPPRRQPIFGALAATLGPCLMQSLLTQRPVLGSTSGFSAMV